MGSNLAIWMPGGWELIVILAVGLLLFGGRLPEVGKSLGRSLIEFRKGLRGLKEDVGLGELDNVRREINDATRPFYDEMHEDPYDPATDEESIQDADYSQTGEAAEEGTVEPPPSKPAKPDAAGDEASENDPKVPLEDVPEADKGDGDKPPAFGYRR